VLWRSLVDDDARSNKFGTTVLEQTRDKVCTLTTSMVTQARTATTSMSAKEERS
jgi:hypothetical protein